MVFLGWTGVLLDIPNVRADACVADILFEVSSVAQAISLSAPLRAIAAAQNFNFPTMLKVWINLCAINYPEKMVFQGGILMHVMVDTGGQDEEGSMFWCMNVAAEDVAKALLKSMFDDVFFHSRQLCPCAR